MKNKSDYIKIAAAAGSAAQTFAGAKKFLLKNWVGQWPKNNGYSRLFAGNWKQAEAVRVSDADAKRARDDKKFHVKYLRALAREVAQLNRQPVTLVGVSAYVAGENSRKIRIAKINAIRKIATGKNLPPFVAAPLSAPARIISAWNCKKPSTAAEFEKFTGSDLLTHGRKWELSAGLSDEILADVDNESKKDRRGKWRTISNADHRATFRCFGLVCNSATLAVAFGKKEFCLVLPLGMRWEIDANGIKAVAGPDDYHPTMADCLAGVGIIAEKLAANKITREKLAAEKLADAAEMAGVFVCVRDSLRAGNCLAGTQSFAQRHNLDCRRHYSAPEILAQANGDESRVRLAIRAAISQHKIDCERGYSVIDEHCLLTA